MNERMSCDRAPHFPLSALGLSEVPDVGSYLNSAVTNFRLRRLQLGMSQMALGQVVRISQPVIGLIERGRFIPTEDQLARCARALGWPVGDEARLLTPAPSALAALVADVDDEEDVESVR